MYTLCWAHDPNIAGDFKFTVDAAVPLVGPYQTTDDIYVLLEDHQVLLQTMLASRFVMGIKDLVTEEVT